MASNHTSSYGLSQWLRTDAFSMDDFNLDNQKIDAALKSFQGSLRIATGSYVATNLYGSQNPNTLNFDFTPYLVLVSNSANNGCSQIWFQRPMTVAAGHTGSNYAAWSANSVTWTENGLSWYAQCYGNGSVSGNTNVGANDQYNYSTNIYYYLAIGK